jgi:alkylation response protein AidB-like acyl-CoA dehydrogenase
MTMSAVLDEINEIRTLARQFAAEELRPHNERWDHEAALDADVFAQLTELGFPSMRVPETHGGMGLGIAAWAAAVEELAWGEPAVGFALAQHGYALDLLHAAGAAAVLQRVAGGGLSICAALAEDQAGTDLSRIETTATPDHGGWRVSGEKRWVSGPSRAELAVVLARTDAGPTLFVVPADDAAWRVVRRDETLGLRPLELATVRLDGVRVGAGAMIGEPGRAQTVLQAAADAHRIGIAAVACGIARAALEHARDYAAQREQFGRALRRFQGIQFKLADMATHTEAAQALLDRAVERPAAALAAMAKLFASETAMWVTTQAVQIFGGYGYMRDYPVEKLMRDAKAAEIAGGANELLRVHIAEELYHA